MIVAVATVLVWGLALWLLRRVRSRRPEALPEALARARRLFIFILPRIFVGIVGAGFAAELLPGALVATWFGDSAGFGGIALATLLGAATPGGPFIAFAIGASALKSGAGEAALVAYVTAWSVICVNRTLAFELPMMGARFAWLRVAVSAPLPLLLGGAAMLI